MKLWRRREAVSALAGALPWAVLAEPPPLRFATDANDQSGLAPAGRAVLSRALQRLGLSVRFDALPLRRSLRMTEQGQLDGETLRIRGIVEGHPHLLLVPVAIATVRVVGWVRQRAPGPGDWSALPQLRVGYPRGIVLIENLLTGVPQKIEATTHADLLRLLRSHAIDIALLTLAAGEPEPDAEQMAGLALMPSPLSTTPLHPLLHESHRELLPRLTATLQQMEDSGESERLRRIAWNNSLIP
ncbi:substrate-binding periplasmic protein [Roseateles sp. NT4]|uniref:substrate-binding periplasmic protein n=1 Tax=Roseateles sp. NT4 TaxID=3453715 RepID=UPI003EEBCCA9